MKTAQHETVSQFMTPTPHTINVDATLAEARTRMNDHGIRHLPVLSGGKLVGLVSQRDIQLLETLQDVKAGEVPVEEAMSQDVLTVARQETVRVVAERMARRKAGSAVVVEKGRVVGIFTTMDALKVLAAPVRSQSKQPKSTNRASGRKSVHRQVAARGPRS